MLVKAKSIFAALAGLTIASSAVANGLAVGTDLCLCGGGPDLLPGEFIAQTFVLNSQTAVSNAYFVIGTYSTSTDNIANPINYGTLSFNMALTNSIGPGTTAANVIANATFSVPTSSTPQYNLLSLPLSQLLAAGTYYLVASTSTPTPSSSSILALPNSSAYFPNVGQQLTANNGTNVTDMLNGCSSNCNTSFPPASTWIPSSGPAPTLSFEFQLCSQNGGTGCGLTMSSPPVSATPLPPSWTMMLIGLTGFGFAACRRKDKASLEAA